MLVASIRDHQEILKREQAQRDRETATVAAAASVDAEIQEADEVEEILREEERLAKRKAELATRRAKGKTAAACEQELNKRVDDRRKEQRMQVAATGTDDDGGRDDKIEVLTEESLEASDGNDSVFRETGSGVQCTAAPTGESDSSTGDDDADRGVQGDSSIGKEKRVLKRRAAVPLVPTHKPPSSVCKKPRVTVSEAPVQQKADAEIVSVSTATECYRI
jgi:hypothetical protein